jgi:hypothetical protein
MLEFRQGMVQWHFKLKVAGSSPLVFLRIFLLRNAPAGKP